MDLTNSNEDIVSWVWGFAGIGSSTVQNPQFIFPAANDYNVQVSTISSQGCSDITNKLVAITEAQSPDASFIIPTSVCLDENVEITNTSVNGTSYVWDFCFEDLLTDPLVVELGNISGSNLLNSLTLVYDLGNWYGFGTNQGDDKLLRLDFGTSLDNVPNVVDLGDLGILNLPRSLELVNEGSNWYGLLVNINGNSVIGLSF